MTSLFLIWRPGLVKTKWPTVNSVLWQNQAKEKMSFIEPTTETVMEENEDTNKRRFEVELEFVQCLSNPHYLNFLAQHGYFKDPSFVNYLKYLLYWKEPQYAKFLKYPQCLYFLELLQYEEFRKELLFPACVKFIDEQQLLHWQYYARKRRGMHLPSADEQHAR